ncbi:hypothetical protein LJC22_00185 [Desulfosarcina sp. OttesenSCG-928-G10]|nr:hypothetical protein [Desulfosarcina sp. OttesenSCG-928-G10]MDL2321105.1 hypothetical protein [Desulfosarcina sp. OttesenSCG-928-B08]
MKILPALVKKSHLFPFSLAFHSQRKALGLPKIGTALLLVVLALLGMGFRAAMVLARSG